jgi:hypothetical protein
MCFVYHTTWLQCVITLRITVLLAGCQPELAQSSPEAFEREKAILDASGARGVFASLPMGASTIVRDGGADRPEGADMDDHVAISSGMHTC